MGWIWIGRVWSCVVFLCYEPILSYIYIYISILYILRKKKIFCHEILLFQLCHCNLKFLAPPLPLTKPIARWRSLAKPNWQNSNYRMSDHSRNYVKNFNHQCTNCRKRSLGCKQHRVRWGRESWWRRDTSTTRLSLSPCSYKLATRLWGEPQWWWKLHYWRVVWT
jgi:hypothetical protein